MGLEDIASILEQGGVGILPTDTLYGLVGSANSQTAVERIYKLKKRDKSKPLIILISDIKDLSKFGVELSPTMKQKLNEWWPGPVSAILEGVSDEFEYLHRGGGSLAFRLPKSGELQKLLKETGPLVAPSANPEGKEPARNIAEAWQYFGEEVDFYIDGGDLRGKSSVLIKLKPDGASDFLRGKL